VAEHTEIILCFVTLFVVLGLSAISREMYSLWSSHHGHGQ